MKTKSKLTGLFAFAFFLFLFSTTVKAQCSAYTIDNNLGCAVKITFQVLDDNPCNTCSFQSGFVVPASTTGFAFNCGSCIAANVCNIRVKVTDIGGTAINAGSVDFNNPSSPLPSVCGASNLNYGSMVFTIN